MKKILTSIIKKEKIFKSEILGDIFAKLKLAGKTA